MALHTVYFGFSANTQGWGNMENRCAALYHIWSALAIWCDPDKDAGLDVEGLLSFAETMGDSYECSENQEVAQYAAFSTPGIGTSEGLNHESGWLNRSQYLPTKSVVENMSNMLDDSGLMSGLTIQRLSTNTSGVTALGLKMFNGESYASNQAVKWDDLYFELTYDDQPIRALNQIRVNVTDIPDIPASGGEVTNRNITYVVEAEYTDNPGVWVVVTPETASNVSVTANTLSAAVTSERTFIDTFDLTVAYGGKSATTSNNSVYQEINELTTNTRTGSTPHSSTYTDDEHYEIDVNPTNRQVDYDDMTTTISVVGEYVYDNVTESYTDYEEAVDSAYTSNVSITGEWGVVSSSTPTLVRQEVRESAAVVYSENESWITGVTINGNSSTIGFTQNGFNQRTGVVRYLIDNDRTVYEDFTLTQNPEGVELESISVAIDKESLPLIPASGGEVDCDDITFYVIYTYNDSSQDIYTSTEGTWDVTPPSTLEINCTGVTGYNLRDEIRQETKRGTLYIEAVDGLLTDDDNVDIKQEANELEGHNSYNGDNVYTTSGSSSYTTTVYEINCAPSAKTLDTSDDEYDVLVSGQVITTLHEMEWPRYYETTVYWSGYTSMYSATTTESGLTAIDDLENAQPSQHDGDTASTKGTCVFVSATNNNPAWLTIGAVDSTTDLSTIEVDENSGLAGRNSVVTYKLVEDESNQTIATHEISQEGVNAWIRFVENGTVVDISTLNVGPYAGDDTSIDVYSNVDWRIAVSSQDISVVPATDDTGRTNITITLPDNIGVGNQAQVYTISAISTTYPDIYDVLTINQSALEPAFDIDDTIHTTGSGAGSTTASVTVVPSGLSYTLYPGNLSYSVDGRPYIGPSTFTGDISSMTLSWGAVDYEDPSRVLFISGETSTYNLTDAWEIVQESGATTPMKNVYVRVPVVMGYKGDGSAQISTNTDILDNFIVTINGSYSTQKDPSTTDYGNGYVIGNGGSTLGSYVQLSGLQVQDVSELTGFTFGWRAELDATDYVYLPVFIRSTGGTWHTDNYFVGERSQDITTSSMTVGNYATTTIRDGNILIDFAGVRLGAGEAGAPVISYSTSALTGMFLSLSNPNDIPAAGGTISSSSYNAYGIVTVTHHWTNGTTTTEEVGHTDDITITWGSPVSAESLYDDETPRNYIGDLTATASCTYSGVTETDTDSIEIYQEANTVESWTAATDSVVRVDGQSAQTREYIGSDSDSYFCGSYPFNFTNLDSTGGSITYDTFAGHNDVYETTTTRNYTITTTPRSAVTYTSTAEGYVYGTPSTVSSSETITEEDLEEVSDNVEVISYSSWVSNVGTGINATADYAANSGGEPRNGEIILANASDTSVTSTISLSQRGKEIVSLTVTILTPIPVIPANGGSIDYTDMNYDIEATYSDGTTDSVGQNEVNISSNTVNGNNLDTAYTPYSAVGILTITAVSKANPNVSGSDSVTIYQEENDFDTYNSAWTGEQTVVTRNQGTFTDDYISCTPQSQEANYDDTAVTVSVSAVTVTTTSAETGYSWTAYSCPYSAYTSGAKRYGTTTSTQETSETFTAVTISGPTMVRVQNNDITTSYSSIVTGVTSLSNYNFRLEFDENDPTGAQRSGSATFTNGDASVTAYVQQDEGPSSYTNYEVRISPASSTIEWSGSTSYTAELWGQKYGSWTYISDVTSVSTWSITGAPSTAVTISAGDVTGTNTGSSTYNATVICSVNQAGDTIMGTASLTINGKPVTPTPTTRSITIRNTGSTHLDVAIFNTASPSINTTNVDGVIELEPYDGEYYFEFTIGEDDLQYTDSNGDSEPCVVGNTYYVLGWNGTNSWNISASQGSGTFQYGDNDITVIF